MLRFGVCGDAYTAPSLRKMVHIDGCEWISVDFVIVEMLSSNAGSDSGGAGKGVVRDDERAGSWCCAARAKTSVVAQAPRASDVDLETHAKSVSTTKCSE
jgi:hypothetical protein